MAKKKLELRFISDPGHGWAEVPETLSKSLGLGTDFTCRNGMLYMEEDCEAAILEKALAKAGYAVSFVECDVDSFDEWMESDSWPGIPKNSPAKLTKEVYPTVAELRRWLADNGVPEHWQMRQADYHINFFDPANNLFSAGFSLVPEDKEEDE
jgi:hypothetical protein